MPIAERLPAPSWSPVRPGSTESVTGSIVVAVEQKVCLPSSRSVVESLERPTAVADRRLSGKPRLHHVRCHTIGDWVAGVSK